MIDKAEMYGGPADGLVIGMPLEQPLPMIYHRYNQVLKPAEVLKMEHDLGLDVAEVEQYEYVGVKNERHAYQHKGTRLM